jgi:hypothetical protein
MTELWQHDKLFVVALLVWLGGGLLVYLFVHLPLAGPVDELRHSRTGQAGTGRLQLAHHYARPGAPVPPDAAPYDEAKEKASERATALDTALEAARERVEFRPAARFSIPEDAPQRPFEYTKVRDAVAAELRQLAHKAGAAIPSQLDPRSRGARDLPKESQVDDLLFRLGMTDRLVRAALDARLGRVALIDHKAVPAQPGALASRLVEERIEGGLDQVVRFIELCSTPPDVASKEGAGILAARRVHIEEKEGGSVVRAAVTLAAVKLGKAPEPRRTPRRETEEGIEARRSF